ncbi:MAG: response regulator [Burkholderiales bacterium]|jgi:DNA-binding NarL/FixJ family response regulator
MLVLLIDDHALFRSGMRLLLSDLDETIDFVEAASVEEVSSAARRPDLVLLDLNLRGVSGMTAFARIRALLPESTVVALSGEEDPSLIREVIEDGASGFIPKASTPEVMIGALRLVLAGGVYLPPAVLERRAGAPAAASAGTALDALTARQLDALMLAVRGKSNKQIARELDLSEGTVKQHLSAAFRVLGVSNRTEAVYATAEIRLAPAARHGC